MDYFWVYEPLRVIIQLMKESFPTILTLGRQPSMGIAELESLYGAENVKPYGSQAAFLNIESSKVDFARLGGSTRLCKVLAELPASSWSAARDFLAKTIPDHEKYVPEGKLTIGVSVIGIKVDTKDIERCLLGAKKAVKALGRSVRIVPNKTAELNAAQVIHNNLTGSNGWELVIISNGATAFLAQTVSIQDIEGYAARDQARPYRDARVGMLPPKLAQTIINLAVSKINDHSSRQQPTTLPTEATQNLELRTQNLVLLDPFCGTGVLLQEASLMGFDAYGTDLEPRMVEYSIGNMHWIREKFDVAGESVRIELGDATEHKWQQPIDLLASETYLGQAYASLPPQEQLQKNIRYVDSLHRKFLFNLQKQVKKGTRICLAVPAWYTKSSFLHLPVLDHLQELGYNRVKFVHVSKDDLIYHRENQIVGRELVVLVKD